jgi:predicted ATPase
LETEKISIIAGGYIFEAAETVCTGSEPHNEEIDFLDLRTSLVDKSLLVRKEQSGTGGTRFRMLEVVREYALELLQACMEAETMRRRHACYFRKLGEESEPHLQGEEAKQWLEGLENEHDNIRAALNWSLANDPETAASLAGSVRLFWNFRGHLIEGRQWLEKTLDQGFEISRDLCWKILFVVGIIAIL